MGGGLATPGGTVPALQVTARSGQRSSHRGGELRWETVLPRFAYSFMMMKKLIRCPSLHADSPNTPLRYLFSLVSLAPQTTHSTAQNRLAPPCSSSPCPHTRTWATTFCWGNAPAPDTPVLWGSHISRQASWPELLAAFLSPQGSAPARTLQLLFPSSIPNSLSGSLSLSSHPVRQQTHWIKPLSAPF